VLQVPDAAADVERAVRFVKLNASTFGVDPHRLGALGGSAGGHLSLMLGLDPDAGDPRASDPVLRAPGGVAAVVAFFPPVDLVGLTGPNERFPALEFPNDLAHSVSPIRFASRDDPLVPIAQSQLMHAALKERGVVSEFVTIEGGAHGFGANAGHNQRATALMVAWFERHLLGK
jgi:acetyl esterase/lipase